MTNEDYHAAPGLNASKLKTMDKCPALIQWAKDCPEDEDKKKVLDIGNAFHCLVLEPDKFNEQYAVEPILDRRTKAGKHAASEFESENSGKTILTAKESKQLLLMRGSVMAHPVARQLLENQTGTEISIFTDDDGQIFKIRIDLESKINGKTFVVDLKTIDKQENISKAISDRGYALQEAHYREVYRAHHGDYPDFFLFLFVAKSVELGRYPCVLGELSQSDLDAGHVKRDELVEKYKQCKRDDSWPGITVFDHYRWAK